MSRRAAAAAGKEDASNAADVKDLWGLIMEAGAKELESRREINVLFLGARNSGKTTLINRFLKKAGTKDEAVKPTTALDYRFARRTGNDASKEVAHIWELGTKFRPSFFFLFLFRVGHSRCKQSKYVVLSPQVVV
eukprot:TRINITY_DN4361_c0_g1_i4.p1 TRINITY_DN4361_c0_g1~~TRINITY_DN4361_c0_g1_i4.p1  ORF type:complete len:135 (+),score=18.76 TRINITY_DN4361_c0_g1_i4:55-459(+)